MMERPIIDAYAFIAAALFFSFGLIVINGVNSENRKEK